MLASRRDGLLLSLGWRPNDDANGSSVSVRVMTLVFDTALPPRQKLVLLAYADHANDDGSGIYPGEDLVAQKTSYSVQSVRRITAELVESKLLRRVARGWRGQRAEFSIDVDLIKALIMRGFPEKGSQDERERLSLASRKALAGESPNHHEPSEPGAASKREALAAAEQIRGDGSWTEYLQKEEQ